MQLSYSLYTTLHVYQITSSNLICTNHTIFILTGLGFNIKGGLDVPYLPSDPGIFVAKIRETGAAAEDGRLQEGDKIIEVTATW